MNMKIFIYIYALSPKKFPGLGNTIMDTLSCKGKKKSHFLTGWLILKDQLYTKFTGIPE
jgi:hypothetical protein